MVCSFFGAGDGISTRGDLRSSVSRREKSSTGRVFYTAPLQIPSFHKAKKSLPKRIDSFLELEMGFEPTAY